MADIKELKSFSSTTEGASSKLSGTWEKSVTPIGPLELTPAVTFDIESVGDKGEIIRLH